MDLDRFFIWTDYRHFCLIIFVFLSVHLQPSALRKEHHNEELHQENSWLFLVTDYIISTTYFELMKTGVISALTARLMFIIWKQNEKDTEKPGERPHNYDFSLQS